jgi:hypothetical protein
VRQELPIGDGKDVCELVLADIDQFRSESSSIRAVYRDLFRMAFYLKARELQKTGLSYDMDALHREVSRDLEARIEIGAKKYGTRLKTNNGRRARLDLQQEIYDAIMYTRQEIEEQQD